MNSLSSGSRSQIYPVGCFFKILRNSTHTATALSLPLCLSLDLEPNDCLIYEGIITDIPIGSLTQGSSRDITIPVCFLTDGQFEIMARVRPVGLEYLDTKPAKAQLVAAVRSQ